MKHRRNFKGRRLTALERKALEPLPSAAPENKAIGADAEGTPLTTEQLKEFATATKSFLAKSEQRLTERIDEQLLEARRPVIGEDTPTTKAIKLPKEWDNYLRKGFTDGLEEKALSAGVNPEGGYTVPQALANSITPVARDRSNIRAIASVQTISTGSLDVILDPDDLNASWVGEASARSETNNPNLKRITIPAHEIYAMPKATQTLLDDSAVNIEEWLSQRVRDRFDRIENAAFVSGDGVAKPMGFLSYTKVNDTSWSWERIGYLPTGTTGLDSADDLIDLVYTLKAEYRTNASWVMNSATAAVVRKLKDGDGRYVWLETLTQGQPPLLLGYPVVIAEDMLDVADGAFPIAFGDFRRGYTIVDRIGIRVLRDPYSAKPFVLFYTTKRVGGAVTDFDAIKLLKTAAS
jgi:HK97 family phage major capsid protein